MYSAKDGSAIAMYSMAGFAEYSVVPINGVYKVPDALPKLETCILGCAIFTAYGAVKNAGENKIDLLGMLQT